MILLYVLSSCQQDEREFSTSFSLQKIGETALPFPDSALPNTFCMKYFSDSPSSAHLFYLNKANNSIILYDMNTKSIAKEIVFPKEGQQGFGIVTGFTIHNLDTIYISSSGDPTLYVTDTTGVLKQKIRYDQTIEGLSSQYTRLFSRPYKDVIVRDNYLVLSPPFPIGRRVPSKSEINNHPMFIKIDDKRGAFEAMSVSPPSDYFKNNQLYEPTFAVADAGDKIAYSYYSDHNVHYTVDGAEAHKKAAQSDYIKELEPTDNYNNPAYYYAKAALYRNLFYDPYRNLFYRIAKHAIDNFDDINMKPEDAYQYPPTFSIIILDKNLDKIGEVLFDEPGYYDMYQTFVGREGIYISTSNPFNPDYDENKLTFEIWEPYELSE